MRVGALRERVILQRYITVNNAGSVTKTWGNQLTAWAKPVPQGGREYQDFKQTIAEANMIFKMRNRVDDDRPKVNDRISWDGRFFDIKAVENPDIRRRFMVIQTVEHQSA